MKFYIVVKKPKIVICDTEKEAIIEYFKDDHFLWRKRRQQYQQR